MKLREVKRCAEDDDAANNSMDVRATANRQKKGFQPSGVLFYLQIYPLNVTLARERRERLTA